jgi:hypothetical protein
MLFLANSNQKVIRLNVSVKEVTRVHEFDSLKLNRENGDG